MSTFNWKAALRPIIALALAAAGLVLYIVTGATGYLSGSSMNPLPVVLTAVAVAALLAVAVMGGRMPDLVRDVLVVAASALVAASLAMFIMARVTLAADVYFIPVNYPAAEQTALNISIAGAVCYLVADVVLIVEAFAARPLRRPAIAVEPASA